MAAIGMASEVLTIEEFVAWDSQSKDRHELWAGHIVAMAGGSGNHLVITSALALIGGAAFEGKECGFFGEGGRIVVPKTNSVFLPDAGIACPLEFSDPKNAIVAHPIVLFEVLSPSTESFDRTKKFDAYKTLPSLQDYVLIASEEQRVEVFSRHSDGKWLLSVFLPGTIAHVPSVGLDIPLDRLYSRAIFEAAPSADSVES